MPYPEIAALLQERLGLETPPVALALVQEPPDGVARFAGQVPSACSFWRRAEHHVFYASAEDHLNCPIGAMVMGFDLPAHKQQELQGLVEQMCRIAYLQMEEVPHISKFTKAAGGIVYGPLAHFPLEPEVVVVWTTPMQAMLLQEAVGNAQWAASPQGAILGRPACGALPTAVARGTTLFSLGCMGMRTYTEVAADRFLVAIPGAALASLGARLEQTLAANAQMQEYYRAQKARY